MSWFFGNAEDRVASLLQTFFPSSLSHPPHKLTLSRKRVSWEKFDLRPTHTRVGVALMHVPICPSWLWIPLRAPLSTSRPLPSSPAKITPGRGDSCELAASVPGCRGEAELPAGVPASLSFTCSGAEAGGAEGAWLAPRGCSRHSWPA